MTRIETLLDRHRDLVAWIPMHPSQPVRRMLGDRLGRDHRVRLTEPLGPGASAPVAVGAAGR